MFEFFMFLAGAYILIIALAYAVTHDKKSGFHL